MFDARLGQIDNLQLMHSGVNSDLFRGHISATRQTVVVKSLREHKNPNYRKAFENQVRVLGRQQPGTIPLWSAELRTEIPYYVMPYLPGGRLTQHAGVLAANQLHAIAERLAFTMTKIHAASDIHGDFKPDNILIDGAGEVWLADPWGNPSLWAGLFTSNSGGTPGYWAPEVRSGLSISPGADVYSFGAAFYHLATGRKPEDGQRLDLAIQDYALGPWLREMVAHCCDPNPAERPSMPEVMRLLRGEQWASIVAKRAQNLLLGVACIILVAILVAGSASDGPRNSRSE